MASSASIIKGMISCEYFKLIGLGENAIMLGSLGTRVPNIFFKMDHWLYHLFCMLA
jgi:hypothetical protein